MLTTACGTKRTYGLLFVRFRGEADIGQVTGENRKMTGYPPMTQPSTSFELETDCAAREERRILAGRECGIRYHPALRPCFARHFGPGPRM
jgi:hypothetical protein